jgi:eukaryotic-like serine/threonine-protein kinase
VNAFPAAGDYYKAVQAPARSFTVPKLRAAEFVWDSLGPTLARGSSAVVFQASVEGKPQALRCYIRNDASSRDRYSALDAYLAEHDLSPYVSGTTWLDDAITVNRATWPVLTMEWIDGRTLNEYVDFLVTNSNAAALTTLAAKWRELVALLQDGEFAHGDLQHGNVMVDQDGRLRLVDFDGVWIPQLAEHSPPSEFGHPNYQHPLQHVWDRWLDTFSALVIYLSLVALGKDPALWLALYNSKNLLFAKNDFFLPFETETWKQLAALGDPQVDELCRRLQECCDPDWVCTGSLEMTLDQQAVTPARQPIPVEQRWWERKPAPASSAAAAVGSRPGTGGAPGTGALAGTGGTPRTGAGTGSVTPQRPRPQGSPSAAPAMPAAAASAAATTAAQAETSRIAARSLPAPPPLSAPLGMAGTGPNPQLSQVMAVPGQTSWWTGPTPGQAPPGPPSRGYPPHGAQPSGYASHGSAPHGSAPQVPAPQGSAPQVPAPQGPAPRAYAPYGSAPRGPVPPAPGAPVPGSPAPAPKRQPGPVAGGVVLGLGIVLLIIGAASHVAIIVIGGLAAGAWGIWRLVTGSGTGPGGRSGPGTRPMLINRQPPGSRPTSPPSAVASSTPAGRRRSCPPARP